MTEDIWDSVYRNLQLLIGVAVAVTASFFVGSLGLLALAVIWVLVFVAVGLTYLIRTSKISSANEPGMITKPVTQRKKTGSPVCDSGPYELVGGEYVTVPLNVNEGDEVKGRLEEVDGDDFDWWVIDERNVVDFRNDDAFVSIGDGQGLGAYFVNLLFDGPGPWFLVLDNAGRRTGRIIEVNIRRE